MQPVVFGVMSAIFFALQIILTEQSARRFSTEAVLWGQTTIILIVVLAWVGYLDTSLPDINTIFMLLAAGCVAPLIARALYVNSIVKIGSNHTVPIVQSHPMVTVFLGVLILGERLKAIDYVGIILVMSGGLLVAYSGTLNSRLDKGKGGHHVMPRQFFPAVLAAFAYGGAMIIRKQGLDSGTTPQMAAVLTSIPAMVGYTLWGAIKKPREVLFLEVFHSKFIMASGVCSALALVLWHYSISNVEVSFVAPLASLVPIFALLLNFVLFRNEAPFNRYVVFGTTIGVAGVTVITYHSFG